MSLNCTTDRYADLYAPWLQNPGQLLDLAGYDPDKETLVDLCGGSGVICEEAQRRGASYDQLCLLDLNCRNPLFRGINADAEEVDLYLNSASTDVVVCRQAMAYLNPEKVIPAVAAVLKPGGRFVFSTFKRPRLYRVKTYEFQGERYLEFHASAFGRVLHLQKKYGPHGGSDWSLFKYHPVPTLHQLLYPYFLVDFKQEGRSCRWVCTKRLILEG